MTWSSIGGALVGFVAGAVLAVLLVLMGPSEAAVCGGGHLGNRIAQDISRGVGGGHTDGANGSYCTVPTTGTWSVVGVVLVGTTLVGVNIGRQRR